MLLVDRTACPVGQWRSLSSAGSYPDSVYVQSWIWQDISAMPAFPTVAEMASNLSV